MTANPIKLLLGGVPAEELVATHGSPLYVYEEDLIRDRYDELNGCIEYPKKRIHYAAKANSNLEILSLLRSMGSGIDATSPGEVFLSLKAGFSPNDIIFTGVNSSPSDLRFCHDAGVQVNIGSLYLLEQWGRAHPGSKLSVRVNPDVGAGHHDHTITGGPSSKFGIYYNQMGMVSEIAERYDLEINGVHAHIGSGILETDSFIRAMDIILKSARGLDGLEFIDIGGGIGIPYRSREQSIDLAGLGASISSRFQDFCEEYGTELELKMEPGRYLVAEAGTLLVTVTNLKQTPRFNFIGVDSGFNHLQRPIMYGSFHEIQNASRMDAPEEAYVVGGNLCESGDVFTRGEQGIEERMIPIPEVGDILALRNSGAYGFSMASTYNGRLLPAEVIVSGGRARLIRERQTFEDLIRGMI
ncbi:MAG: diaminopimelate decarboxylase [Candidatus Methanofastidiosa archaeon]|nr:diaminopimelate decarboxylase [Candidatus Methanofastidiosa archaeon]